MVSNKLEKNLILEKIKIDEAVLTIQSAVRAKQARVLAQSRREERIALNNELELYYLKGDLPADHARTIRTEGQIFYFCFICIHYHSYICIYLIFIITFVLILENFDINLYFHLCIYFYFLSSHFSHFFTFLFHFFVNFVFILEILFFLFSFYIHSNFNFY